MPEPRKTSAKTTSFDDATFVMIGLGAYLAAFAIYVTAAISFG